ncbi:MAG: PadR family transcriptional regulator [Micromonosporaceae bacterium]
MRPRRDPVNLTSAALLGLLHSDGGMTASELARLAEQRVGPYFAITRSQVFTEVKTLTARELVAAGPEGPRGARPLEITDAGREAFHRWITSPVPEVPIRSELLLRIRFGELMTDAELAALIAEELAGHRSLLAEYERRMTTASAPGRNRYNAAVLQMGIYAEQVRVRWLEELPDLLQRPGVRRHL